MVTKLKKKLFLGLAALVGACSFQNKISEMQYINLKELEKNYYETNDTIKVISLSKKQYPEEIDTNLKFELEEILKNEKNTDLVVFPEFSFIDRTGKTFFSKENGKYVIDEKTTPVIKNEIKKYQELAKKYITNLFLGGFYEDFYKGQKANLSMIQINKEGDIVSRVKKGFVERDNFSLGNGVNYLPILCWEATNNRFSYNLIKHLRENSGDYDFLVFSSHNVLNYSDMDKIEKVNSRKDASKYFKKYFETGLIGKYGAVVISDGHKGEARVVPYSQNLISYKEKENYVVAKLGVKKD